MKRKFFIFACLLLAAQPLLGQSLKTEKVNWKGKTMAAASDYVMVKLKDAGMEADLNTVLAGKGLSLDSAPNVQNIARLKIESRTKALTDLIDDLQNTGIFEFVEPDFVHYLCATPNDTYYGNQYGPTIVEAPDAWGITTGSSSIMVGILDTGIPISSGSLSHPDLQNTSRIIQGVDYVGDGNGVKDERGHGTHVAGIAGAETNNSTGVAGMGWSSKLRIYQVFDDLGRGFDSYFYNAVINAVDNGCQVINFSGGMSEHHQRWRMPLYMLRTMTSSWWPLPAIMMKMQIPTQLLYTRRLIRLTMIISSPFLRLTTAMILPVFHRMDQRW